MPDLTPAQIADFDDYLAAHRVTVARLGPAKAMAALFVGLAASQHHYLAALAAHAITRLAQQDPIRAITEGHPLTIDAHTSNGARARCGCGWTGEWITSLQLARVEHAAHVHTVAQLAQEQPATPEEH